MLRPAAAGCNRLLRLRYARHASVRATSCFWLKGKPRPDQPCARRCNAPSSIGRPIHIALCGARFQPATKSGQNTASGTTGPDPGTLRFPESLMAERFRMGWPVDCLCPGTQQRHQDRIAAMPAQLAGTKNDTGNFTMPAVRQPALPHRNACHAGTARIGPSAPFRRMARMGHAQHAARCMHASAERRLQARSPQGVRGGPGRWPFHACAICAPPCCRVSRH
ncbi:hypothetical protein DAMDJJ_03650 [Cupriavidus necator]